MKIDQWRLTAAAFGACATLACATPNSLTAEHPLQLPSPYHALKPSDFPAVVLEVEASVAALASNLDKSAMHGLATRLHLHPQNPEPNVRAALENLEFAASLDPGHGACPEIQTWLLLLRQAVADLDERQELQQRVAALEIETNELKSQATSKRANSEKLRRNVETLTAELEASRAEIEKLQVTIDKLQRLDMRMEQRRRSVRTKKSKRGQASVSDRATPAATATP